MNAYTKSLKNMFGTGNIEQVGSKWFVTSKKYSPTTSKHSTQFCNGKECERVGEEVFRDMLSAALFFKNGAASIDEGKLQNFVNSMSVS